MCVNSYLKFLAGITFLASSAESVGRFRFWKFSQRVIESDFHGSKGTKTIGSSSYHSNFVVETLHGARRDLAFGAEPVQNEWLMSPQHPGNFLHRFQTAAQGAEAPGVEKGLGPDQGFICPEM